MNLKRHHVKGKKLSTEGQIPFTNFQHKNKMEILVFKSYLENSNRRTDLPGRDIFMTLRGFLQIWSQLWYHCLGQPDKSFGRPPHAFFKA
jgi:hypothetical protein